MTLPSLAECLGQYLTRSLYSYGQLAELAELPRRTVANWISGVVTRPRSWQELLRVARALKLNEAETNELLRSAGFGPLASLRVDDEDLDGRQLLHIWIGSEPARIPARTEPTSVPILLRSYLAALAAEMARLPAHFPSQVSFTADRISQQIHVRVASAVTPSPGGAQPWGALAGHFTRTLVIGPGGIGKTHLLRRETMNAAHHALDVWPIRDGAAIPLFVRLADLAPLLPDHPRPADTLRATARAAALQALVLPIESVEQMLLSLLVTPVYPLLISLDGWDEVNPALGTYQRLKPALNHLRRLPATRLILTSRPEADYEQAAAAMRAQAVVEVLPLTMIQVQRFIRSWFYGRRDREWPLRIALRQSPELARLAATPLMLTMLTILADLVDIAQTSRIEMYDRLLRLVLEGRWRVHDLQLPEARVHVKLRLLQVLAWRLATSGGSWHDRIPARELEEALAQHPLAERLRATWFDSWGSVYGGVLWELTDWDNLLRAEGRTGLDGDESLYYGFLQRTFQYHLVAAYLLDRFEDKGQDAPEVRQLAQGPVMQPEWMDVLRLLTDYAHIHPDRAAGALLATLLLPAVRSGDPLPAHIAVVIGELEAAGIHLDEFANAAETVRERLLQSVQQPQTGLRVRVYAGRLLGTLGDPRPAVSRVDRLDWVRVPGGPLVLGGDGALAAETGLPDLPQQTAHVVSFWMSRTLITNAHYAEFAREGYQQPDYWPEARALGVWRAGQVLRAVPVPNGDGTLTYHSLWTSAPHMLYWPFDLPNHPISGINWFEARAFARWLEARLRVAGQLPAAYCVDLPSELEWEKAARGTDGRIYPWGDDFAGDRLNWLGQMLHGPTAVGSFADGESPYGFLDMAGNLMEWTRTVYLPYDLDGRAIEDADSPIVMRGGGYFSTADACRCAARQTASALGHLACGFRVALVPEGQ